MRVAKTGELDVDIMDQKSDGFGRDPLPEYLEHARLDMRGNRHNADNDNSEPHHGYKDTSAQEVVEVQSTEEEGLVAGT